jgi:hypothetical protein
MRIHFKYLMAIGAIIGIMETANATPTFMITDGVNTVLVPDNGVGDSNSAVGQVTWIGSLGNWTLNVDTATTYPALGTLASPALDLGFNAISNGAGGSLWISFSANGFGPTMGMTETATGGTVMGAGTVAFSTFGANSNTLFDSTNSLSSVGPFAGPAFSNSITGSLLNNQGPYSLTETVQITSAGASSISGDASFSVPVPDGGMTVMLLSVGLLALGAFSSIKKRHLAV